MISSIFKFSILYNFCSPCIYLLDTFINNIDSFIENLILKKIDKKPEKNHTHYYTTYQFKKCTIANKYKTIIYKKRYSVNIKKNKS